MMKHLRKILNGQKFNVRDIDQEIESQFVFIDQMSKSISYLYGTS